MMQQTYSPQGLPALGRSGTDSGNCLQSVFYSSPMPELAERERCVPTEERPLTDKVYDRKDLAKTGHAITVGG